MNQHETTPNSMMSVVKRGVMISGGFNVEKNRVSLDPKTYPDDLNHLFLVAASGG